MIGNQVALRPDGAVVAIQADGIALSPDTQWLYYRPLTDHNYWRVPTSALRDATLSAAELAGKVEYLGSAALSGGLIMDTAGTLYGGDLEHRTVVAMTISPDHKLGSKVFVSDPARLSWPTALRSAAAISTSPIPICGKSPSRTICRAPGRLRFSR